MPKKVMKIGVKASQSSYEIERQVESTHWWFVVRRRLLKSLLATAPLRAGRPALDVGCGVGSNLITIASSGFPVIGVDREMYALELTRQVFDFPLINGDLARLPIRSGSIGLVVAMDVFEHLENDLDGIRSIYEALEKGGTLIFTVPAFGFLWGIQDEVTGHWRRYSKAAVLDRVKAEGFEVLRSSYFNFFLFLPILLARKVTRWLGLKIRSENEVNSPLINATLKAVFSMEPYLLRALSFPFGVSIFCIARKN